MSTERLLAPLSTDHIIIILVRSQSPGNIGSVARAMHNMGLSRLSLVQPQRFPHAEARMMACNAQTLLQQAQVYHSLSEAVSTCHWLIGTSARRRQYRKPPLNPRALAHKLPGLCQQHQVGIIFGPEDAGLTTSELNLCHELMVIPTVSTATSLNLAQAVMVTCYEILQARYHPRSRQMPALASVQETEAMYEHLRQAFAIRGFSDTYQIERVLDGLRRLFDRVELEQRDVRLIRGIARQLGWALRHPQDDKHLRPNQVAE
ncbi:MAG: RNA methyltransferase, partial [bacterium]|nr:RNA methyltransferase [bacterium]